jgi:hypothetical protein
MNLEHVGETRKAIRCNSCGSIFISLDLLKSYADSSTQFGLRESTCEALRAQQSPNFGVSVVSSGSARPLYV